VDVAVIDFVSTYHGVAGSEVRGEIRVEVANSVRLKYGVSSFIVGF
jgi:hypothetical protein